MNLVAVHKVMRFSEEIRRYSHEPFTPLLQFAFDRLARCTPLYEAIRSYARDHAIPQVSAARFVPCTEPNLPPYANGRVEGYSGEVSPENYATVRAIMNRYEFEIEFRRYQHQLGLRFGISQCQNVEPCN